MKNEENNYVVYKHTCPNGKVYIGITKGSPEGRWSNGFGYNYNYLFFSDIVKYGWDNIEHEILVTKLDKKVAQELEKSFILKHRSNDINFGYNIICGKDSHPRTLDIRQRISESMPNKIPVAKYDLNGNFIAEYKSTREAYRQTGVRNDYISRACKNNSIAGGYRWKYVNK